MEDLFNVIAYRKKLVDYYRHACDNTKERYEQRRKAIENYEDSYLEMIIKNTHIFCLYVLEKLKEENNFFSFIVEDEKVFLYNHCSGGGPCDELFVCCDFSVDFWISKLLLKSFFEGCRVEDDFDEEERYDEEIDAGIEVAYPKINIIAPVEKFNFLYEQYRNELSSIELKRFLIK